MYQKGSISLRTSITDLFGPLVKEAARKSKFKLKDSSHAYILSVLERCLFSEGLFTGGRSDPMILELLFKALQEERVQKKQRQLKYLGEGILFKSGFFAESFKRKMVGIEHYINMGSLVYKNLYQSAKSQVYEDISNRFSGYVDLFSEVSSKVNFSAQEDLLVLFDRYLGADSEGAMAKLIELGVVPVQNKKSSNQ